MYNTNLIAVSGKIKSGKDLVGSLLQYYISKKIHRMTIDSYDFLGYDSDKKEFLSGYKIVKFADKLKDIVCDLLNCTREDLEDRNFREKELGEQWWYFKEPTGDNFKTKLIPYIGNEDRRDLYPPIKHTPRTLMQLVGTEAGREILHPDIWVNATFEPYTNESKWIITDTRFLNELNRATYYKGITLRVNRNYENRFPEIYKQYMDDVLNNEEKALYTFEDYIHDHENELYKKLFHKSETSLDDHEDKFDEVFDNNSSIRELSKKIEGIVFNYNI